MSGTLGSLVIELAANTAKLQQDMGRATHIVESSTRQMASAIKTVETAFKLLGGFISFEAILRAVNAVNEATRNAEESQARLASVLKSTGYAAGITASEMEDLSNVMMQTTGFDDESIKKAGAELMKFGSIQGNVFREALALSADVAAALDTDLPEAARLLGKSLVEPETAFGLLKRQGVALSEQQKDLIKSMAAAGNVAGAQKVILEQLERAYSNTAVTMNTGIRQAANDLKNSWDNLLEAVGKTRPWQVAMAMIAGTASAIMRDLQRSIEGVPKGPEVKGKIGGGPTFSQEQTDAAVGAMNQFIRQQEDAAYVARKKRLEELAKAAEKAAEAWRRMVAAMKEGALDDLRKIARDAAAFRQEMERAAESFKDLGDPARKFLRDMEQVKFLMDTINVDTGKPFMSQEEGTKALSVLHKQMLELKDAHDNMWEDMKASIEGWGRDAAKAIVEFTTSGKMSFSDMVRSWVNDISTMIVYQNITKPLSQGVNQWLQGVFAPTPATMTMPGGGVINLPGGGGSGGFLSGLGKILSYDVGTDYVPYDMFAKIHKGEAVVPAEENKRGRGNVTVNMTVVTPDANSFRASSGQITAKMAQHLGTARRNL